MAGKPESEKTQGEGPENKAPASRFAGRKVAIYNTTQAPIILNYTRLHTPKTVEGVQSAQREIEEKGLRLCIPPLTVQPVIVEGEVADLVLKDPMVEKFVAEKALVLDRRPGMDEIKATASTPQVPDEYKNRSDPGTVVREIGQADHPLKVRVGTVEPAGTLS